MSALGLTYEQWDTLLPIVGLAVGVAIGAAVAVRRMRRKEEAELRRAQAPLTPEDPSAPGGPPLAPRPATFLHALVGLSVFLAAMATLVVASAFDDVLIPRYGHAVFYVGVVGLALGLLWMAVYFAIVSSRRTSDLCPDCGRKNEYLRKHAGLLLRCKRCGFVWKAGW